MALPTMNSQIANVRLLECQATDGTQQSDSGERPNARLGSGWEAPDSKKARPGFPERACVWGAYIKLPVEAEPWLSFRRELSWLPQTSSFVRS